MAAEASFTCPLLVATAGTSVVDTVAMVAVAATLTDLAVADETSLGAFVSSLGLVTGGLAVTTSLDDPQPIAVYSARRRQLLVFCWPVTVS